MYKQAIQDWKMAQTLFKETKISVFREILVEVDSIAGQMRDDQYRKLEGLQGNFEARRWPHCCASPYHRSNSA